MTPNYDVYSRDGIKFLFIPSPAGILARNTVIPPDVTARVDSIVTLQIHSSLKGKALIAGLFFGRLDFSLIVFMWLTLVALAFGYESLHTKEYLKFLSSITSHLRSFFSIILARFLLFSAGILLLFSGLLVFLKARGLEFSNADYAGLAVVFAAALGMMILFFMIGVYLGTFSSPKTSLFFALVVWFILVILVPGAFVSLNENKFPDITADFQTELDKYSIVTDYEKISEKKVGKFDRNKIEIFRKLAEEYWNVSFKQIEALEGRLKAEIQRNIDRVNRWAVLCPTTFFMLTCNEASGKGYASIMQFYSYVMEMQRKFVRFWINRVLYHDPTEMVSFIKEDENIFRSSSRLPKYWGTGMASYLIYSVILFFLSYARHKRVLFPQPEKVEALNHLEIDFKKGKHHTFRSYRKDFNRQLLNLFFGKAKGLKWKISLDGKDINNQEKKEFLYLPNPDKFPGDLKAGDLLVLIKGILNLSSEDINMIKTAMGKELLSKQFCQYEKIEKARFFMKLAQLKKSPVYIFEDFVPGIPGDLRRELSDLADKLKARGALVIDMTSTDSLWLDHDFMVTIA